VYDAAYGGNSLWAMAGAHRVSASCAQDGMVPVGRQSKLESVEENIFSVGVVRCGKAGRGDQSTLAEAACSGVCAFHNGNRIALG
jgi:hypothetical protein